MEHAYMTKLREAMTAGRVETELAKRSWGYAENLINQGLPVLFDDSHVNAVLRTGDRHYGAHYHSFALITGTKVRKITAPSLFLKKRQRWILRHILEVLPVSEFAHGFEANRSIKTHAAVHASHEYVLCLDLKDFFPSIPEKWVRDLFASLGYTPKAAGALAALCCYGGILPQGAPTSPKIANLLCRDLDNALSALARARGLTYSRYADDLTFSSDQDMADLLPEVNAIIQRHGFYVNGAKTRLYPPGRPKIITGLVVQNGRVRVPKRLKRELKKDIYFCRKWGVLMHLENSGSPRYVHYREHLYGKAYYVKMIEPEVGRQFLEELDRIDWPPYMK